MFHQFVEMCSRRMRSTAAACITVTLACGSPMAAFAQASSAELPVVVVLSTGGTIAGRGGSSTSLTEYKSGSILGSELVDAVPEIKQHATVRVEQIANIGSTNMNPGIWLKLATRINAIFSEDPKVAGVVMSMVPTRGPDSYYTYGYGYGYGYGSGSERGPAYAGD